MTALELTQKELKKLEVRLVQAKNKPFYDEKEISNLEEKIRLKAVIIECLKVYENMPANQNN